MNEQAHIVPLSRVGRRLHDFAAASAPPVPVLMITPPSIFLLDERVFMSLGILKVAACLEQRGHAVEMVDLSGVENYVDVVGIAAKDSLSKFACITVTTPQLPAVVRIVEKIREARPDMRIICGGPHPTLVHSAVKMELKRGVVGRAATALKKLEELFDVIVSGDGEEAIFLTLLPDAPKVIDADIPGGDLFMTNASYNASPMPARHLVDVASYKYSIEGKLALSAIFQLGCPFKCNFCGGRNSKMLRKIRTRTTESIVAEVEHLYRTYGAESLMVYDDELNVNPKVTELMHAIGDMQERLGIDMRMRGFVKSELFNDEQAIALKRAGFRWILCGFESAHPRILENIQKNATVEDNTRVIDIAHRHGLKVKALMSVGHAGESEETILAVRDWLIEHKPDDIDCTVISTYPGTDYYDLAVPHETLPNVFTYTCKKSGDRLHSYDIDYLTTADFYKGDPSGGYQSYVFTDYLRAEDIVRLRDLVESEVRAALNIPFNPGQPGIRFETSMGQRSLPSNILRKSS